MQAAHAAIDFQYEHKGRASPWHENSNYLVFLAVENQKELEILVSRCKEKLLDHTIFREPDIGDEITAVAIEPSPSTQKLISKIPLL